MADPDWPARPERRRGSVPAARGTHAGQGTQGRNRHPGAFPHARHQRRLGRDHRAAGGKSGLVEIEAHRHKRVTPIDLAATRDLLDVQAHLWRLGYERGIPALDSAQMRDLRLHVGVYRRVLDTGPEHDPADLWSTTAASCRAAIERAGRTGRDIAAIGITNQRETVVAWDRSTGEPLTNAIVWQDRRTEPFCAALREAGHEAGVQERTGLLLDPYFSGTKMRWMLDNVPEVKAAGGS